MMTAATLAGRAVDRAKLDAFDRPKTERVAMLREMARQAAEAADELEATPGEG